MEKGSEPDLESWGELVPAEQLAERLSDKREPITYQFRPVSYLLVDPERRQEWEDYFVRKVGKKLEQNRWANYPQTTISGCSNGDDYFWCDCDMV